MVFILFSWPPRMAPRTPKDVIAAGPDGALMHFSERESAKKTGLNSVRVRVLVLTDGGWKQRQSIWVLRSLTFELSWHRRLGALGSMRTMGRRPSA